jgi:hypothetical protein
MTTTVTIYGTTYTCTNHWAQYSNGRPALVFLDAEDKSPVLKASVNLADSPLRANEMALDNDFAEELGPQLVAQGFLLDGFRTVRPEDSFVAFRIYKLSERSLKEIAA